jgi:hypothetical protein
VEWRALVKPVALSLPLYCVTLGIQGLLWIKLFGLLTGASWNWEDVYAYFTTHLMRRLPGAPWYIAGRAAMYYERGSEAVRAAFAVSLLEWSGIILSGLVWVAKGYLGWTGAGIYLLALIISMPLLQRCAWLVRWVPLRRVPLFSLYFALLVYEGQWFLGALILYLLLHALNQTCTLGVLETIVFWAISGIISSFTVFAPAGLGVRELSLIALLKPHVGLGHAALGALLMRVIFAVGDMLWGLILIIGATSQLNTS